jgi:hypothetical protein
MGEVWRATDSKLQREVAIKVLPDAFTEDQERLARFEREAQLLAQLHHPNIASIFGLEESDGVRALVMELVEGPTLAERLEQGSLPLAEVLSIAQQIAVALEEAHERGIVHRDLKPQNVKASIEGKVKVLDFGLAKAMDPTGTASGGSASQLAASPTLTLGATVQGVILGTAAYMAPEQAAGGTADRRADVWSFGVVLYEMLSGKRLFEGETVSHVLAGVLKEEPDFSALPADTPPRIRRLVRRCLRKKPRERLQAIGDARIVLDEVLAGEVDEVAASVEPVADRASRPAWQVALAFVAAIVLGALVAFGLGSLRTPANVSLRTVSELPLPEGHSLARGSGNPALSPDGTRLAFVLWDGTERQIWIRNLATGAAVRSASSHPATTGSSASTSTAGARYHWRTRRTPVAPPGASSRSSSARASARRCNGLHPPVEQRSRPRASRTVIANSCRRSCRMASGSSSTALVAARTAKIVSLSGRSKEPSRDFFSPPIRKVSSTTGTSTTCGGRRCWHDRSMRWPVSWPKESRRLSRKV